MRAGPAGCRIFALIALAPAMACSRPQGASKAKEDVSGAEGGAAVSSHHPVDGVPTLPSANAPSAAPAVSSAVPMTGLRPAMPGESHRTTIPRLDADAVLRAESAALQEHFGHAAPGPFRMQRIDLTTGAAAVLVSRADESDPLVLVTDHDALEWSKLRPTAGMVPPAFHTAIAPRADGGMAVFVWVAKLHTVAARMWADNGDAFGDFEVFKPDACDDISAASVPGSGWIIACSSPAGVHAVRAREDVTPAWDSQGVLLGADASTGPATIAVDSASSLMLLERVAAVGGDRVVVYRYDLGAHPLWPTPVDLGLAPSGVGRIDAALLGDGVVRVNMWAPSSPGSFVQIESTGRVTR